MSLFCFISLAFLRFTKFIIITFFPFVRVYLFVWCHLFQKIVVHRELNSLLYCCCSFFSLNLSFFFLTNKMQAYSFSLATDYNWRCLFSCSVSFFLSFLSLLLIFHTTICIKILWTYISVLSAQIVSTCCFSFCCCRCRFFFVLTIS